MNQGRKVWVFTEFKAPLGQAQDDETLIGALSLAVGPVLCEVQMEPEPERLWWMDAGQLLLAFARFCAREVQRMWPATVGAIYYLSDGDPDREVVARVDARRSFEAHRWPASAAAAQSAYWAADCRSPAHVRAHQAAHWARKAAGAWARGDQPPNRRADADRNARADAIDRQEAWLREQVLALKPKTGVDDDR